MKSLFGFLPVISVAALVSVGNTGVAKAQTSALLAPGDSAIDADRITPHQASWRLVVIRDGQETEVATFERAVDFVNHSRGEPSILTRWHFQTAERSGLDIYYLDRETLTPFVRYVTSPNGMWVQYQKGGKFLATLTRRSGGEPLSFEGELPEGRFNNAMIDLLLAALPLEGGFTARLPTVSTSAASLEAAIGSWVDVEVVERDTATLPDGERVEVWSVRIAPSGGNVQLLSVAPRPPYLLERRVMNPSGQVTARWELTEVSENESSDLSH